MSKSYAHRCAPCDVSWPYTIAYAKECPLCGKPTFKAPDEWPITSQEAVDLTRAHKTTIENRKKFDNYYVDFLVSKLNEDVDRWNAQCDPGLVAAIPADR